ncbi:TetR/AcrR family transcriptional regulator [Agromyces lapidis]|uniref:TetR/AcrR family transcriptional regulator n=1 Tax=Agromyces lapidis TaxID=279574 RepID=A0ABV5STQ1_9MICO|nr:TetR/AcrR family transcriptional regulator [Agromyces lapidis]
MATTRERWLDEGLTVLATEGAPALRIDRLAARLGVTKGSFHHHFDGSGAYKQALLAYYEQRTIAAIDEGIATRGDGGTRATLEWLSELALMPGPSIRPTELDAAVRAWAHTDGDARATQARIDARIIDALQAVWRPATSSDAAARTAALVPYLVSVGAAATVPPIGADELRAVYRLLLEIAPLAGGPSGDDAR